MSKASYIVGVQYTRQGGTYSAMLVSNSGDLYQQYTSYDENTKVATGISPSFETNPPTLEVAIFNSKKSGSEVYPNRVDWKVGNTDLEFDSSGLSTTLLNGESGHFQRIAADATNNRRAGLKIVKNMVVASNAAPFSISAQATVANGMSSIKVSASTSVAIKQASVSASIVNISVTNGGLVSASGNGYPSSVVLTANVTAAAGVSMDMSSLRYKWFATDDATGLFVELAGKTSKTLTVTADDVNQSRMYKVVVTKVDGTNVGQDTQVVTDVSDPLRIEPNPYPADEQIIEGDSTHSQVYWEPRLFRGETEVTNGVSWSFVVYDTAGASVYDDPITDKSDFIVTEEMVQNYGNVQVVIGASVN